MRLFGLAAAVVALVVGSTTHRPVVPTAIPLGGEPYVGTSPHVGFVDSCQTSFGGGGALGAGPWIDTKHGTWDAAAKPSVRGAVHWPNASFTSTVSGASRVLTFDDLPTNHTTGVFPVAATDPASAYDRNPNHIAAQSVTWRLALDPVAAPKPSCLGMGATGVLTDGVYLYDGLDAGGRDAAAYEVLDACGGHPDQSSSYHHHDVPPCLLATAPNGTATLVGYALDGYGIYVVKNSRGTMPTDADLDVCHGTTSRVRWNGTVQSVYHYVATLEYPYTLGCYHGTPLAVARRPPAPGPPPGAPPGP